MVNESPVQLEATLPSAWVWTIARGSTLMGAQTVVVAPETEIEASAG